jgi:phosphoribosyl 1,2-cyclic phosphodiesterase
LKFWGTRGSIPTPGNRTKRYGGNTLCVEIRVGEHIIICDAGSGIRELGASLMTRGLSPIVVHLLLTHSHWDHIQGFPFFVPAYVLGSQCYIYGKIEGEDRFYKLLSGQMVSDYFPVQFADLRAHVTSKFLTDGHGEIGPVKIKTYELQHPGGCIGYSFQYENTKIVYATDNEIDCVLKNPKALRAHHGELRIAPDCMVGFMQDADLLISDSQYTDEEHKTKVGWGHPSCITAVDLAVQAHAKRLALFHHDPSHSDADVEQMVDACRRRAHHLKSSVEVFAAREGVEFKF